MSNVRPDPKSKSVTLSLSLRSGFFALRAELSFLYAKKDY